MSEPLQSPFDRTLLRQRRDRAARGFADADFLYRRVCEDILDRLSMIRRGFRRIAVLGAWDGDLAVSIERLYAPELVVQCDLSPRMAGLAAREAPRLETLVADEEALPFAAESLDLILAPLTLHSVNDLPGTMIQMRRALKPDGLLLCALYSGDTLAELRNAFARAELETVNGVSPRVAPMAELRELGGLLQRAGFALPVADRDTVTVTYADVVSLMRDLRNMGETNILHQRHRAPLRRETLMQLGMILAEAADPQTGRFGVTFDIAYLHGWAPSPDQPKPLPPGSATMRLSDALGAKEIALPDKAGL